MSDLSELGRAALWYVENGFAVFPCVERGKRPAVAHGLNDWTDNPATVRVGGRADPLPRAVEVVHAAGPGDRRGRLRQLAVDALPGAQ